MRTTVYARCEGENDRNRRSCALISAHAARHPQWGRDQHRPVLAELLGLLVPPRCALCASPCAARAALCEACEAALGSSVARRGAAAALDRLWSAAAYEGIARDLVLALKFGARLPLAAHAAATIASRAPPGMLDGAIVPVPPAPARRRWRGFDSAEAIASALGAQTGLPVTACLRRSEGRRQVGRPRRARIVDPPTVGLRGPAPERAILVDDVVTTGATMGACARALRGGGCVRVAGVTFARTN